MSDELRERMVNALAEYLEIDPELASRAMHHAWETTANYRGGSAPASWQPDPSDPAQALARRAQAALEREFDGEDLFPCVLVVQENMTRRIGFAATAIPLEEAELLLRLGMGAARRTLRQFGEPTR